MSYCMRGLYEEEELIKRGHAIMKKNLTISRKTVLFSGGKKALVVMVRVVGEIVFKHPHWTGLPRDYKRP
jgi:hypothetical protein